jgi:hypothetical protein
MLIRDLFKTAQAINRESHYPSQGTNELAGVPRVSSRLSISRIRKEEGGRAIKKKERKKERERQEAGGAAS